MKPQPIYLPNKNYFAWPYEEQTQIKHRVLEAYSKVYMSKLGGKHRYFICRLSRRLWRLY